MPYNTVPKYFVGNNDDPRRIDHLNWAYFEIYSFIGQKVSIEKNNISWGIHFVLFNPSPLFILQFQYNTIYNKFDFEYFVSFMYWN